MKKLLYTTLLLTFMLNISAQERFTLPTLAYAKNALSPTISEQTMELHYGKHLQAYVNNLNKLIIGTKFETAELETIVKESEGALFNNAGQTLNHNLYFEQFSPTAQALPTGKLLEQINTQWGSVEIFKKEFEKASMGIFGSGWAWLAKTTDGKLEIVKEANAGNPITKNMKPLLGFDVWEHAYYIDYQNKRADHLTSLWKIVDWKIVEQRFNK